MLSFEHMINIKIMKRKISYSVFHTNSLGSHMDFTVGTSQFENFHGKYLNLYSDFITFTVKKVYISKFFKCISQ